MTTSIIDKISKLMSQSQSAHAVGNDQEAKVFEDKATELMNAYNIEQAQVLELLDTKNRAQEMTVAHITVGEPGKVGLKQRANFLAWIIQDMFGIRTDLRYRGDALVAYGTMETIKDARIMVEHLVAANVDGINEAKKKARSNGERFSRLDYDLGFFSTLYDLSRSTKQHRDQFVREFAIESKANEPEYGNAIALRNMEVAVKEFYNTTSNARGSFNANMGSSRGSSYSAGVSHANNTSLTGSKMIA